MGGLRRRVARRLRLVPRRLHRERARERRGARARRRRHRAQHHDDDEAARAREGLSGYWQTVCVTMADAGGVTNGTAPSAPAHWRERSSKKPETEPLDMKSVEQLEVRIICALKVPMKGARFENDLRCQLPSASAGRLSDSEAAGTVVPVQPTPVCQKSV